METGKKAISGVLFLASNSYLTIALNFFFIIVLVRLIDPKEFGIFAMALVLYNYVARVRTFGLNYLLIQSKEENDKVLSTHWITQIALSILCLLVLVALMPIILRFYKVTEALTIEESRYVAYAALALAAIYVFDNAGVASTPMALLERAIEYRKYSTILFTSFVLSNLTGIGLAYLKFGVWSLVAREGVRILLSCVLSWIVCPWRPKIHFDFGIMKQFFRRGKHLWVSGLSGNVLFSFDDFIVGALLGTKPLGYYDRAYRTSLLPCGLISSALQVVFPVYSKYQDDLRKLSEIYGLVLDFLAKVGYMFAFGMFIVIPEFTLFFYGEDWMPLVPMLRCLLLYSLMRPVYDSSGILVTLRRERALSKISVLLTGLMLVATPIAGYYFQVNGVAVVAGMIVLVGVVLQQRVLKSLLSLHAGKILLSPLLMLIPTSLLAFGITGWAGLEHPLTRMIVKGGTFFVSYTLLLMAVERRKIFKQVRFLWDIATERERR